MGTAERFNMVHREWEKYINDIPVSDYIIPSFVQDSWERCKANKVNPYLTRVPNVLDKGLLEERIELNKELIDVSLPFMKTLYSLVIGSGFIVALSDTDGFLLMLVGDTDVSERVKKGNFLAGACWSEEVAGTNGVGTTIKLNKPLQIYAAEHYCVNSHKWTGSGAPIHDSSGNLTGVIVMTGPYEKANPHTLGMVTAAAYAIENEIQLRKALAESRIADDFQRTVISSIPEIIITIDNDGLVSLVNKNVRKAFGREADSFLGKNVVDLWSKDNKSLLNLINNNVSLTDVEARVLSANGYGDFTLSCYPILSMDNMIGKVIILNEIKRARTLATKMIGAKANFNFEDIIGRNSQFLEIIRQARLASHSRSNVLLLGESGTGKDILAQAIHNGSSRRDGPYIAINCSTIPRDLITSELFGYSDGAFTGSRKGGNLGKFELADGGTIFLDEIGETPLEMQAALLRVIEDKSLIRVGGTKINTVDVRIIAATNKNLKEEVQAGKFREDLYYRLNVFTIHLPPLRERKDDIPLLVDYIIHNIGKTMGKAIEKIEKEVLDKFMNYRWPGNVRELQNVMERMINIAQMDVLTFDLLPPEIVDTPSVVDAELDSVIKREQELIIKMINSKLPKKQIAKKLGISRSTLYRKLDEFNHLQNKQKL
jgi:transcriptional regulator of acetoin/glycerol metabolism